MNYVSNPKTIIAETKNETEVPNANPTRENLKNFDFYKSQIPATWKKSRENVIETGKLLNSAKSELEQTDYDRLLAELDLSPATVSKLVKIASDARLSDERYADYLPQSFTALYEIALLTQTQFDEGIKSGTIKKTAFRSKIAQLRVSESDEDQSAGDSKNSDKRVTIASVSVLATAKPGTIDAALKSVIAVASSNDVRANVNYKKLETCFGKTRTDIDTILSKNPDINNVGGTPRTKEWTDKYAPKSISECVLTPEHRKLFDGFVSKRYLPPMLLIGPPGVGKTTLAKLLAESVNSAPIIYRGGFEKNNTKIYKEIDYAAASGALGFNGKMILIDEGDELKSDTLIAMRGLIDKFGKYCCFVITANTLKGINEALISRLHKFDFSERQDTEAEFKRETVNRVRTILKAENVEFEESDIESIVDDNYPDIRATIKAAFLKFGFR